jgi:hypothetical protein
MSNPKPEPMLWLSDSRGIYIPRDFARSFANRAANVTGVDDETWAILESGPDNELYWEAWDDVVNECRVKNDKGIVYTVHQDGDCWLIPDGMEWDEESECFAWPNGDKR